MIDLCDEVAFWGTEGVVSWEMNVQEEDTSGIWTIIGTDYGSLPMELIVFCGSSGAVCGWVFLKIKKFFLDSFLSHLIFIRTVIIC